LQEAICVLLFNDSMESRGCESLRCDDDGGGRSGSRTRSCYTSRTSAGWLSCRGLQTLTSDPM